jgi:serine/threonine protein kinase
MPALASANMARAAAAAAALPLLLLLLLLLLLADHAAAVRFDYASLTLGSLRLLGDAHLKNGTIRLSRDLPVPTSGAGRALYATAVPLRGGFSTQFAFTVATLNPSSVGGGLAFVLATDGATLGDAGAYIGVSVATDAAAVEFDTLMDAQFADPNGNHVALDLGSMVSAAAADLGAAGVVLASGRTVNAWIDYHPSASPGSGGTLEVFVSYAPKRPPRPVLSAPLDLSEDVKDAAFVGFSASTQGSTEAHAIEWWSFSTASPAPSPRSAPPESPALPPPVSNQVLPGVTTTTAPPPPPPTGSVAAPAGSIAPSGAAAGRNAGPRPPVHAAVAGAATAGAFVAASFAGVAVWVLARRAKARRRQTALAVGTKRDSNVASAAALARSPREFSYKELSAATRGFDASRVIGNGAFGTVYKGIVPDTGAMVAVKRCSSTGARGGGNASGEQARSEFLSELSIIAGLRHRNLLRLQGWCYEKGEILLVYDYMRNGSLDRALFDASAPVLPWRHRREALAGVASALAYLHHECERRVVHRDVKSSNVMLDEAYRARLGDFGLARQAEHGESPDATAAAGTMGYLAPEYLLTGRATECTDVFSFGVLALEVACGRRPIGTAGTAEGGNLVEWVWSLHGEARLLDAVDPRLGGEFEEGEARRVLLLGLACSSPEPALRPGMRAVVQVLGGEADPPFVPAARPSMSLSSANNQQLLLSLQDSVSDYNAMLGLALSDSSSDSLSSSSLTSTLRRGGHDIGFSSTAGDAR